MRIGTRRAWIQFERGLCYGEETGCWWKIQIHWRWRDTNIYIRPWRAWCNSEHLAHWLGEHIESPDYGPSQWILKSRILGYHWSD